MGEFKALRSYFDDRSELWIKADGSATDRDARAAAAFFLLKVAHADGEYTPEERQTIIDTLARHFVLSPEEASDLEAAAGAMQEDSTRAQEFCDCIQQTFSASQRVKVLALIWKVVQADGAIRRYEAEIAGSLRLSLGLSMEQAMLARKLVESGEV